MNGYKVLLIVVIMNMIYLRGGLQSNFFTSSQSPWCTDIIVDGGFENGPASSAWLRRSSADQPLIVREAAHTGQWGGRLGTANPGQDQLGQYITLPTSVEFILLRAWWRMTTDETDHPWDRLDIIFLEENASREIILMTLTDEERPKQWQKVSIDITRFAGQSGWLILRSTNDELNLTTWYIDDISILACKAIHYRTYVALIYR